MNDLNTVPPLAPRHQPRPELGAGAAILRHHRQTAICGGSWDGGPIDAVPLLSAVTRHAAAPWGRAAPLGRAALRFARSTCPSRASGPRRQRWRHFAYTSARAVPRLWAEPRLALLGPPLRAAPLGRAGNGGALAYRTSHSIEATWPRPPIENSQHPRWPISKTSTAMANKQNVLLRGIGNTHDPRLPPGESSQGTPGNCKSLQPRA